MKNKAFWVCITIWIIITLIRLFNHQPWFDEANAWIIAQKAHFSQLFLLPKIEGHPFIWYLILMPFAKLNLAYPYSLLIINWLFCFGAVFLIWKYSPFNNFLKASISFSFPFFVLFPIVARCYAISIFLFFILAALFKKKSKHPIVYAGLIFICANTNVMAMIGAFCFGCFLIYDLIKFKQLKNLSITILWALLTFSILLVQYMGLNKTYTDERMTVGLNLNFFCNTFVFPQLVNLIILIILVIGFGFVLFKSKKAFIFITICYTYLFSIFQFAYLGNEWHHYFVYIYLIIAVWLLLIDKTVKENIKKTATTLLIILSLFFTFDFRYRPLVFNSHSKDFAQFIEQNKQARFILFFGNFLAVVPYLDNIEEYDIYHYQTGLNINEKVKKIRHNDLLTSEKVYNLLSKEKINYGFSEKSLNTLFFDKHTIKFIPVKIYPLRFNKKYYIYKIETN